MNIINILADKNDIGLGNVDNTSDVNKPVSTAQQTALNSKENLSNKSIDTALGNSDVLYPSQNATKTYVDNKFNMVAVSDATATTKGIIKLAGDLGGTANSPSVPGLILKENTILAGTTSQYFRGDKTFQTLNKAAVGLANVDNTSDLNKPISTATQSALNTKNGLLGFTPENLSNKENLLLDNSISKYPTNNLVKNTLNNYLQTSLKGAINGLAELDGTGKLLSSQLPSYVDDVLEYANISLFPVTGETGKIYIAINTNISYRWSGSVYVEISSSVALGETSSTAYRGDRGKIAYDHSQSTGNPHSTTKNDIGLANVDNTSDANKPISTATQTALNLITNVNWLGDYNNGYTYSVGDGVMFNGASFRMYNFIGAAGYPPSAYPGNWKQITGSLGFTPENVINKDTDITLAANSDTKYTSQKAVKTYIDNVKSDLIANGMRYRLSWSPNTNELPTYGVSSFGEIVDLGIIKKGDCFFLGGDYEVIGTLYTTGTIFIANQDTPTTYGDWIILPTFIHLENMLANKLDIPTGSTIQYIDGTGALQTFPTLNNASSLVLEVYNNTGATLTKGTIVYINGGHGNLPTITKAKADTDATSAQTLGIIQADLTNMNNGNVLIVGKLTDINTNAFAPGTQLYLSGSTAGTYTNIKPQAPIHLVYVGIVSRQHPTQGIIEVKVQNGYEMDELHDVKITSPQNFDALLWETSTQLWKNKKILNLTTIGYEGVASLSGNTLNIPAYKTMTFVGDFAGGDGYNAGDIVRYNNDLYICILTIGSASAPNTDPTHWSLFIASGGGGSQTLEQTLALGNSAGAYNLNLNNRNINNISDLSANNGPSIKMINLTNAANMLLMYNS